MRRLLLMMLAAGLLAGLAKASPARADWRSLSGLLPPHVELWNVKISPDGHYAVYLADVDVDHSFELYSVALAGGTPVKLNPPLRPGSGLHDQLLAFTPDSQSVLYVADHEVAGRWELFRVPVTGGAVHKVSAPLVDGGNVVDFKLHPHGSAVVYLADQQTDETYELWSAVGKYAPVKRNTALTTGGDVDNFAIDPFNNRIVYSADQETDDVYELYTTPLAGVGFVQKLNPPLMRTGGQDEGLRYEYALSPTAPVVVFIARRAAAPGGTLYAKSTMGGGPLTALSGDTPAAQRIIDFRISPSGTRVVYNRGTNTATEVTDRGMLYSTPIGGGLTSGLSEPAEPLYGARKYSFTPDGERVVSLFQKNESSPARVESATSDNGVRTTLLEDLDPHMPLLGYEVSANGEWVFMDQGDIQHRWMTAYPVSGGARVSYGVGSGAGTPDSSRVVFMRNAYTGGTPGLFSARIAGGDERELSGLQGSGEIERFYISPDSNWIVYVVLIDGRYELRVSDSTAAH